MEFHQGRLIDHVHLQVSSLEASRIFYSSVLTALGRDITAEAAWYFASDELFVTQAQDYTSKVHLAFQARDRDTVDGFYRAAIAAGGRDNGQPGERLYHPGYYAAYILDLDNNNLEAVYHGEACRSAESVIISAPG